MSQCCKTHTDELSPHEEVCPVYGREAWIRRNKAAEMPGAACPDCGEPLVCSFHEATKRAGPSSSAATMTNPRPVAGPGEAQARRDEGATPSGSTTSPEGATGEEDVKCSHDNRSHYLGGGMWVCFRCWLRAFGVSAPTKGPAKITHVALRWKGQVWSLPRPYRHHHIIQVIESLTTPADRAKGIDCSEGRGDQGFLDETGKYLDRKSALKVALETNQVLDRNDIRAGRLFSEDLW